jgi:hypothetical protein
MPRMEDLYRELRRKGVTLQLLWYEYKQQHPNGYQFQDTLPPGNSSDTLGAIRASICPELVDESHIRTGVVNFGLVEMLK